MQIEVLAVSDAPEPRYQGASSYLVNDSLAIDAGTLGLWGTPERQGRVRDVFLTHAHIDHVGTLPLFLENAYVPGPDAPMVHAAKETMDALVAHLFNGVLWPDFVGMSTAENSFVKTRVFEPEERLAMDGLTVVPVPVEHGVPAVGFLLHDHESAVVFAGDSAPTERLWEVANDLDVPVSAVVIEASFPDEMRRLADTTFHLTPGMLAGEIEKLAAEQGVHVLVVHAKPAYHDVVAQEIAALAERHAGPSRIELAKFNHVYRL